MKGAQADILARLGVTGTSKEPLRLGICDDTNHGVVVAIAVLVDNIPAEKTVGLSLKAGCKYLFTKPSLWIQGASRWQTRPRQSLLPTEFRFGYWLMDIADMIKRLDMALTLRKTVACAEN